MLAMRRLVLCLLLVLLPLRSLIAAGSLGCEPLAQPLAAQAAHEHHGTPDAGHDHAAKPCKSCAPCCFAAAPPALIAQSTVPNAPAVRAPRAPAEAWSGFVPALPDPPPRG